MILEPRHLDALQQWSDNIDAIYGYPRADDWTFGPPPGPGRWWIADARDPAQVVTVVEVDGRLLFGSDGKRVLRRAVLHAPEFETTDGGK